MTVGGMYPYVRVLLRPPLSLLFGNLAQGFRLFHSASSSCRFAVLHSSPGITENPSYRKERGSHSYK